MGEDGMIDQTMEQRREALVQANRDEYGPKAADLSWITPEQAEAAESERARLLQAAGPDLIQACRGTKPHLGPLSPGCRICSQGDWSCLFINGRCNCRCFYCPSPQDETGLPTTNRLTFARAADYADYTGSLGFSGVSISGGEPLLTFERSRTFIETVRRRRGGALHIWLYTNGVLLTRDKLLRLRDAGLKEIRFDISAVGYDLEKVALAADLMDCVTIEIPAIPEDFDRLAALLPEIKALGVRHLNLHQLRLTPHNLSCFTNRNYTFLHGEKVTVLESELSALKLLVHARTHTIGLPINYCSFAYKNRYQGTAVRRRHALHLVKGHESVTESGYIRTLALWGDPEPIEAQAQRFAAMAEASGKWSLSGNGERLYFHPELIARLDPAAGNLKMGYAQAVLQSHISYRHPFREIRINPRIKLFFERQPCVRDFPLSGELLGALTPPGAGVPVSGAPLAREYEAIRDYEQIRPGLQAYF